MHKVPNKRVLRLEDKLSAAGSACRGSIRVETGNEAILGHQRQFAEGGRRNLKRKGIWPVEFPWQPCWAAMQSKNGRRKFGRKNFPMVAKVAAGNAVQQAPLRFRALRDESSHGRSSCLLIGRCKSWHPQWWLRCGITSKRDHDPDLRRVSLLVIQARIPFVILCQEDKSKRIAVVVSSKPCMHSYVYCDLNTMMSNGYRQTCKPSNNNRSIWPILMDQRPGIAVGQRFS
jgi:hypothetical protein